MNATVLDDFKGLNIGSSCDRIGIPYSIKPLWGSVRDSDGKWLCSAGYSYMEFMIPEVRNGVVVFFEGGCGYRNMNKGGHKNRHSHGQMNIVLDEGETAILVSVYTYSNRNAGKHTGRVLIGMDDGHPFVHPTMRKLQTVQDTFDWLVPKPVWVAMALGMKVERRGDWFFVPHTRSVTEFAEIKFPITYSAIRPHPCCLSPREKFIQDHRSDGLSIILGSPLIDWNELTNHRAEQTIYRSNHDLVRGLIESKDHPDLYLSDWHVAYRNKSNNSGRRGRNGRNGD